jgi:hypothetical protein
MPRRIPVVGSEIPAAHALGGRLEGVGVMVGSRAAFFVSNATHLLASTHP